MNQLFLDIAAAAVQVKGQELNKTSYKMVTFTFEYVRMYVLHIAKLFSSFSADLSILSCFSFNFGHYVNNSKFLLFVLYYLHFLGISDIRFFFEFHFKSNTDLNFPVICSNPMFNKSIRFYLCPKFYVSNFRFTNAKN